MADSFREPLLDMFIFETSQLLEQIEQTMLSCEKGNALSVESINEIFRAMHTIKGSSAMMMYENIAGVTHAVEDMFYFIRENKPAHLNFTEVADIVLQTSDFIKGEIAKINDNQPSDGSTDELTARIRAYLRQLKAPDAPVAAAAPAPAASAPEQSPSAQVAAQPQAAAEAHDAIRSYRAQVFFEENCQMENIRAFGLVHNLKDICVELAYQPAGILEDEDTSQMIAQNGFALQFTTAEDRLRIERMFDETMFVKHFTLSEGAPEGQPAAATLPPQPVQAAEAAPQPAVQAPPETAVASAPAEDAPTAKAAAQEERDTLLRSVKQSQINVNIAKLDSLMDLVGEIVITEAMVTRNPDLSGLQLDNFHKAARQLRTLTDELQDLVMSVRMVPVANTFHKMTRIVRDMSKKLDKEAELTIAGEDTEVDKNIIDNLSDPLMHLIRNAMDHGIETREQRIAAGKPECGRVALEAVNTGGDVLITIRDDGRGLNKDKIIIKARENGLLTKSESELTDRDIYGLVLLPGFSTKEAVTEFSGRGVGMDVVKRNIEKVGGTVTLDSVEGHGTTVTIKIPLTLAIVDGMLFSVGKTTYTVPTVSIRESFRAEASNVVRDPDGHDMILVRGSVVPVLRLHEIYRVENAVTDFENGIVLLIENDGKSFCLFADKLLGEQQVVVKPLPYYLMRFGIKAKAGIAGCTILGDGSISLILDVAQMQRVLI